MPRAIPYRKGRAIDSSPVRPSHGLMLAKFLTPLDDHAYGLMRVTAGVLFAFHGLQKIFGIMANSQPDVGSQMWVGGLIELIGGAAIALGAFSPWAAFLASGTMAVAYAQFHWKFQFGAEFFPIKNKGELALLYSVVLFFIACKGSGVFSIDALLKRSAPE